VLDGLAKGLTNLSISVFRMAIEPPLELNESAVHLA
jgi:hypothetical protein